jgi:hypothetical protein
VPDLSHLWQRFVLAAALVFGLAVGVGATVFGYSNTAPVNLGWSVFHLQGVPLWAVVLVPLGVVLVAGTLFHWFNSLHHFTEHMRHRRRVHELEVEVNSLRKHLDELLQMPGHAETATEVGVEPEPLPAPALPEPVTSNGEDRSLKKSTHAAEAPAVAGNGSSDADSETETDTEIDTAPEIAATAGS